MYLGCFIYVLGTELLTINNLLFKAQIDNINLFKVVSKNDDAVTLSTYINILDVTCSQGLSFSFQLQKYFEKSLISRKVCELYFRNVDFLMK